MTRTGTSSAGWAGWTSSPMATEVSPSLARAVKAVSPGRPRVFAAAFSSTVLSPDRAQTVTPRQRPEYRYISREENTLRLRPYRSAASSHSPP